MQLFGRFLPYPVQFEPICVLLVHAKTSEKTNFCTNGPMDTISVKSCATVADMRQNLDATIFRAGFRQALQANCWTGYASPARTFSVANHTVPHAHRSQLNPSVLPHDGAGLVRRNPIRLYLLLHMPVMPARLCCPPGRRRVPLR